MKTAPSVFAPALSTTLTETCMGSSSAGVSWLGFGASGGTTWQDHHCIRRLNARELAQTLGDRDAARELMCGDEEVFRVYNALGRPCRLMPNGSVNPAYTAPPPAPTAQVNSGPYMVFFEWNSAALQAEAKATLDDAVRAYQKTGAADISLAGHADKTGTEIYNLALSQRRAEVVKSYLTDRGVPQNIMISHAYGDSEPMVPTANGTREVHNRRVEIVFGPAIGNGAYSK